MTKKSLMETLTELGELQEDIEKETEREMDEWWNAMSKDEQMKAFYSVMKRLVDGELEHHTVVLYLLGS